MATPTVSVTLAAIGEFAVTSQSNISLPVGDIVQVQTTSLDALSAASGHHVKLASSDVTIAKVSTAVVLGAAPAGVIGIGPGTATITATSGDTATATATLNVTVK